MPDLVAPDLAAHPGTPWLIAAGCLAVIAALAHIAIIIGGPAWYRFFGAGEDMAAAAARGERYPALITLGIAAMLFLWAAYAFSGAGWLPRLPLLRPGLVIITAIFLFRGLVFVPVNLWRPHYSHAFAIISSLIVLFFAAAYGIGTARGWDWLAA
ncbi:hypothetical protein [Sphingopyxis sp. MWB1]|uniref:hypothetical protein n=1 Tax=Sphingopyxis sp. MWB1 TaxID=1537715 RepID=UPI000B2092F0|nr:hypothetical protein [Sphingopyxis sp. MWB1]